MNGVRWAITIVPPGSNLLYDRTGRLTLGCTDPVTKKVFISSSIRGELYFKVLLHELGHCAIISYGLTDYIHRMTKKEYWFEAEEFLCNFIVDYGFEIIRTAENLTEIRLVRIA